MKKKLFLVGVLLIVPLLLVGCGVSQESYDAIVAERDSLVTNLQSVQSEIDTAKSKLNSVQSELDSKILELRSAQSQIGSTKTELQSVKSELEAIKLELESLREQSSGLKQVPTPPLPAVESLTYTNMEYGFSVKHPKGWQVDERITGTIVVFTGPYDVAEEVFSNVIIIAKKLPQVPKLTLEDYASLTQTQIKAMYKNVSITDEYKTIVDGLPAIAYSYLYDYEGITLAGTQVMVLKDDFVYVIQYTSKPKVYDKYSYSLDLSVSSFEFK